MPSYDFDTFSLGVIDGQQTWVGTGTIINDPTGAGRGQVLKLNYNAITASVTPTFTALDTTGVRYVTYTFDAYTEFGVGGIQWSPVPGATTYSTLINNDWRPLYGATPITTITSAYGWHTYSFQLDLVAQQVYYQLDNSGTWLGPLTPGAFYPVTFANLSVMRFLDNSTDGTTGSYIDLPTATATAATSSSLFLDDAPYVSKSIPHRQWLPGFTDANDDTLRSVSEMVGNKVAAPTWDFPQTSRAFAPTAIFSGEGVED